MYSDALLVFNNARTYNQPTEDVYYMATVLQVRICLVCAVPGWLLCVFVCLFDSWTLSWQAGVQRIRLFTISTGAWHCLWLAVAELVTWH